MKRLQASVFLLTLSVACSGPAPEPKPAATGDPRTTGNAILRVETEQGGPILPSHVPASRLPDFVLHADGSLYLLLTDSPPLHGQLDPQVEARKLTKEAIEAVLAEAGEAGLLGPQQDFGRPQSTEGPTTTSFEFRTEEGTFNQSVEFLEQPSTALEFAEQPSPETLKRREAARAFYERLLDLESWLPAGSLGEASPATFELFSAYYSRTSAPTAPQRPVIEWPFETLPPPPQAFPALGCVELDLAEVEKLRELAGQDGGALEVVWQSGGSSYEVSVRPVFPGEDSCEKSERVER